MKPRGAIFAMTDPTSGITPAELYGALWLLIIADTFRDDGDRARFASEVLEIREDEWKKILRITSLVSERYFGVASRQAEAMGAAVLVCVFFIV